MKQFALLLAGITLCTFVQAQIGYDDDYFRPDMDEYEDRYYDYDDDDIYKLGFNINNYASAYLDDFVRDVSRRYGIRRSDVRECVRLGFSPSDILFGAELARRSGRSFASVMNLYRRSDNKNWINISINLGIPRASIAFRGIVDCFQNQYRYWNGYYFRRNPNHRPPVYVHDWSYFRPRPIPGHRPHPSVRPPHPTPPHINRPPQRPRPEIRPDRPGNHRPNKPSYPSQRPPQRPGHDNDRPGNNGQHNRPGQNRPERPDRPSRPEKPSKPDNNKPQNNNGGGGAYRR